MRPGKRIKTVYQKTVCLHSCMLSTRVLSLLAWHKHSKILACMAMLVRHACMSMHGTSTAQDSSTRVLHKSRCIAEEHSTRALHKSIASRQHSCAKQAATGTRAGAPVSSCTRAREHKSSTFSSTRALHKSVASACIAQEYE